MAKLVRRICHSEKKEIRQHLLASGRVSKRVNPIQVRVLSWQHILRGGSSWLARQPHKLKVEGSSPSPASSLAILNIIHIFIYRCSLTYWIIFICSVRLDGLGHCSFTAKTRVRIPYRVQNARVMKLVVHAGLKILWPDGRVGSNPTSGTNMSS